MDLSLDIQTAQNVPLALEPASLGQRILATLADGVIVGAWWMASTFALSASGLFNSMAGFILLVVLPVFVYHLAFFRNVPKDEWVRHS